MSQKEEYQRLASQFVDSWQKNTAAMMNDSEFIRTFLQMMQATSLSAKDGSSYAPHQKTSASATSSHDARDAAIAGIKGRIAAIENRLESIEDSLARLLASHKTVQRVGGTAKRSGTGKGSRKGSAKKSK